jgi:hypothetical protein
MPGVQITCRSDSESSSGAEEAVCEGDWMVSFAVIFWQKETESTLWMSWKIKE